MSRQLSRLLPSRAIQRRRAFVWGAGVFLRTCHFSRNCLHCLFEAAQGGQFFSPLDCGPSGPRCNSGGCQFRGHQFRTNSGCAMPIRIRRFPASQCFAACGIVLVWLLCDLSPPAQRPSDSVSTSRALGFICGSTRTWVAIPRGQTGALRRAVRPQEPPQC